MDRGYQNDGLLSWDVQTAIGRVHGILKPHELINLVHQLYGRKNVLDIVKYFINNFNASKMEALIKQLDAVVRESYRSCLRNDNDIKLIKRLIERLEKIKNTPGAGTSEQMVLYRFEENRASHEFLSARIVAIISGVRGELNWNDMIKLLMQVRGRKSTMLEVVKSFTPNVSALLYQLEDIVDECNRCGCKEDSEKKDLQWMKQLIKRLDKCIQPASEETESHQMITGQQEWSTLEEEDNNDDDSEDTDDSEYSDDSDEGPFFSTRMTAVISKMRGELNSKDLLDFLTQVRGKKSATVVEMIKSSAWNFEVLMNQLEDVVNHCRLHNFKEDYEKRDLQWLKQLIKRLDKYMETTSVGTKHFLTMPGDYGHPSTSSFSTMSLTSTQRSFTKTKSAKERYQSTVQKKSYRTTQRSTKKTKLQTSKISTSSQSCGLLGSKRKSSSKTTYKRPPKNRVSIQQMDNWNSYSNVFHIEQHTFHGSTAGRY